MQDTNPIFDEHYKDYCSRLASVNIEDVSERLGLVRNSKGQLLLPFFTERFLVSSEQGIKLLNGEQPGYQQLVIMARYLLNCPAQHHENNNWVAFKDFKKVSHFTNVNFFRSDTETAIAKDFSGHITELEKAGLALGGTPASEEYPYDLAMQFVALPRISLLLLFNDAEEDFPATCTVLFPQHAEWYLDPESLAVTSAYMARRLRNSSRLEQ